MNISAHLFDISHTTDATTLLAYRNDVLADECMDNDEKQEICRAVEKRFAALNASSAASQKPRWK
jgi:hypothetical protein